MSFGALKHERWVMWDSHQKSPQVDDKTLLRCGCCDLFGASENCALAQREHDDNEQKRLEPRKNTGCGFAPRSGFAVVCRLFLYVFVSKALLFVATTWPAGDVAWEIQRWWSLLPVLSRDYPVRAYRVYLIRFDLQSHKIWVATFAEGYPFWLVTHVLCFWSCWFWMFIYTLLLGVHFSSSIIYCH